ncbi:MAG TPA: 3'-5' exonuclease [Saprospiraceae bacterium]|nr:3'-5' exonuclease [Saprospiraceae bacterium]HMP23150.1 3'-5' exonuclease [Saprospiraceae bacterium]
MNFIIYDLEATCWQGSPPSLVQEIIEIGAVRINSYGEVEGTFNSFIRPKLNPRLSVFCQELTSIRQEDVDRARTFPAVVEDFQDWAEIFDEDYLLCSWGSFDKKMLINDCQLYDMEYDWVEPHINLKQQYREIKRLPQSKGLKSALTAEGFEFIGTHHRGIDDAQNLARIFAKYLDEWRY